MLSSYGLLDSSTQTSTAMVLTAQRSFLSLEWRGDRRERAERRLSAEKKGAAAMGEKKKLSDLGFGIGGTG